MKLRSDRRMRNARNKRPPTKHNRDTLEQLCLQTVGFNEREADEAGLSRSDRLTDIPGFFAKCFAIRSSLRLRGGLTQTSL